MRRASASPWTNNSSSSRIIICSPYVFICHFSMSATECVCVCVFCWVTWGSFTSHSNSAGKGRHGSEEGHRWDGRPWDQIWRLCLLRHACGHRTVAVLPGAWCQIISTRTSEETGEYSPTYSSTNKLKFKLKVYLSEFTYVKIYVQTKFSDLSRNSL